MQHTHVETSVYSASGTKFLLPLNAEFKLPVFCARFFSSSLPDNKGLCNGHVRKLRLAARTAFMPLVRIYS